MVHKKADKILHLTFPPLPHRPLFKVLKHPFKHRMSPEGTIFPGELNSYNSSLIERSQTFSEASWNL